MGDREECKQHGDGEMQHHHHNNVVLSHEDTTTTKLLLSSPPQQSMQLSFLSAATQQQQSHHHNSLMLGNTAYCMSVKSRRSKGKSFFSSVEDDVLPGPSCTIITTNTTITPHGSTSASMTRPVDNNHNNKNNNPMKTSVTGINGPIMVQDQQQQPHPGGLSLHMGSAWGGGMDSSASMLNESNNKNNNHNNHLPGATRQMSTFGYTTNTFHINFNTTTTTTNNNNNNMNDLTSTNNNNNNPLGQHHLNTNNPHVFNPRAASLLNYPRGGGGGGGDYDDDGSFGPRGSAGGFASGHGFDLFDGLDDNINIIEQHDPTIKFDDDDGDDEHITL